MANHKILIYAKAEGFCCLWAYITAAKRQTSPAIAKEIGCTPRAVRYAKAKVRHKECDCENKSNCLRKRIRAGLLDRIP